ncbi:MAG: radical SAM protein [Spirochaetes bacterium]|nr:radical SAM protein [Spirochaetota bacterium]
MLDKMKGENTGEVLKTGRLLHGGLMITYLCNAACRHCLYSCSPTRDAGFLDETAAEAAAGLLAEGGCRSVHIGGGEPFLDFERLLMSLVKLKDAGVAVDYIETNAFWATEEGAAEKLKRLSDAGADTFCISIDPFHAEHLPYAAPLALAELCEKSGFGYFLWKGDFIPALTALAPDKAHSRAALEKVFSGKYIADTARSYGVMYGGRAVNIEREFAMLFGADFFLDAAPCRGLLSTNHFHVDKDGFFIPPGCTGIRIPLQEAVRGIAPGKYPAFEALYTGGIAALFRLAARQGFSPDALGYPSKCNLCFHLRRYLAGTGEFPELDTSHYEEALMHYG